MGSDKATSEYVKDKIDFFFKNENGDPVGNFVGGAYRFYLPEEEIKDLEAVLSAIFHKNVKLDLTQSFTIFEEVLDNDYTFAIINNAISVSKYLDIFINNNRTYVVSYNPDDINYENFSVVSDKLNNQTE